MSVVLVNNLNIRNRPSFSAEKVGQFQFRDVIKLGKELIIEENKIWLKFDDESGNERYVCVINNDDVYVNVSPDIQGPRHLPSKGRIIPKQTQFPDLRIQRWGCCFLCVCVKGGLTTFEQCMDCFHWGINTGKLRPNDCWIKCDKEAWAREISQRYGTPYHGDYVFQKSDRPHFWLTQGGREIFNSMGIGYR